jgi:hypothetical protein
MEVMQVPDRPASQTYAVAGRFLFIESFDLQLASLVEPLVAGWQLTPVASLERSPDIRMEFYCGDSAPQIPSGLEPFETAYGGQCYADRDEFYFAVANSLIHLENGTPVRVRVWFDELPAPGDPMLARVSSFAACAALRRFGVFELHSAAMVHPGSDRGVLIIGPSGRGKSTLAVQLAMAGWPYLSDDELLLSLVDGEVEVTGFRSFFAVNGGVVAAAGIESSTAFDSAFKTCFEPDAVFVSGRRLRASPGVLLFTSVSGEQKTQMRKLTQAESMARLIRACPWATYDRSIASANLNVLSKLARQTKAFDLDAGRDLLQPQYASEFLSEGAGLN